MTKVDWLRLAKKRIEEHQFEHGKNNGLNDAIKFINETICLIEQEEIKALPSYVKNGKIKQCPHWRQIKNRPKQENGYCDYLKQGD